MTTRLVLRDGLLDAQLLRTVGAAPYDGADLGECLQAARAVKGASLDSWHDVWTALADRVHGLADTEQAAGHLESARRAYLRASTYYRTAGVMLFGLPVDPRLVMSNRRQTEAFQRAAALMTPPAEVLRIPYEGTTLPGYFLRAGSDDTARATVVLTGGYDGTCEELYFFNAAAALQRGYHVLAFDGPGQGAALLQQGMVIRADWDNVVGPVLDYACGRPEVDSGRIALIGLSLGGFLAPRAASGEHRIAALVADSGSFDLHAAFLARLPKALAAGYAEGRPRARALLGQLLTVLERRPTAGWALRRGQHVHGADTPLAYLDALRDFSLAGHAERISCPAWVCNAEGDDIGASAPQLVNSLTVEKRFVRFTAAEGAGDHCEAGARTLYHARSFGWLDEHLHP